MPTLAAWRRAFRAFGVDPTAYRSAAEALLRRLTKQGSIPSINVLVDIGNLVAIRYGLPVAMFDQRTVTGGTTVRFAAGTESFTDLGSGERETGRGRGDLHRRRGPRQCAALVLAAVRRECVRSGPAEVLVTVEGHHDDAEADIAAAVADLEALLATTPIRRPWSRRRHRAIGGVRRPPGIGYPYSVNPWRAACSSGVPRPASGRPGEPKRR